MNPLVEPALPPNLKVVVEAIGLSAALQLAERQGGVWLYVPKGVDEYHPLAEAIGLEAARKLCRAMGGETFYLPNCGQYLRQRRHRQIVELRDKGLTVDQLAHRFNLTSRQIWRIIGGDPSQGGGFQQSLFDD